MTNSLRTLAASINFDRACPAPVALVLLPWYRSAKARKPAGVTIAKRDATGKLYGCRDVSFGQHFRSCVDTWAGLALATENLVVEDYAGAFPA